MNRKKSQSGMTLIEIIAGIAILGLAAVMILAIFGLSTRINGTAADITRQTLSAAGALEEKATASSADQAAVVSFDKVDSGGNVVSSGIITVSGQLVTQDGGKNGVDYKMFIPNP